MKKNFWIGLLKIGQILSIALIAIIFICLMTDPLMADSGLEPVVPITDTQNIAVRVIEGKTVCYAGYGAHQPVLRINGQITKITPLSGAPSPFILLDSAALNFGCSISGLSLEYHQINEKKLIHPYVSINNDSYDSITLKNTALNVSYALALILNRLYIDLGMGYSQSQYTMQTINITSSADVPLSASGFQVNAGIRFLMNHFISFNWRHSRSLSSGDPVLYSNTIGINFMAGL